MQDRLLRLIKREICLPVDQDKDSVTGTRLHWLWQCAPNVRRLGAGDSSLAASMLAAMISGVYTFWRRPAWLVAQDLCSPEALGMAIPAVGPAPLSRSLRQVMPCPPLLTGGPFDLLHSWHGTAALVLLRMIGHVASIDTHLSGERIGRRPRDVVQRHA